MRGVGGELDALDGDRVPAHVGVALVPKLPSAVSSLSEKPFSSDLVLQVDHLAPREERRAVVSFAWCVARMLFVTTFSSITSVMDRIARPLITSSSVKPPCRARRATAGSHGVDLSSLRRLSRVSTGGLTSWL